MRLVLLGRRYDGLASGVASSTLLAWLTQGGALNGGAAVYRHVKDELDIRSEADDRRPRNGPAESALFTEDTEWGRSLVPAIF
jgi:hypothetical protein